MLIYNTTYHLEEPASEHFLVWINEVMIPQIEKNPAFAHPRLCKLLSHQEPGHAAYTLQWEVDNSASLHKWHLAHGEKLNQELVAIFKDKVQGIPTLMEIIR